LRDSVELEWEKVPSVAVVHESMHGTAKAMARVSGMPDFAFVTVGYPHIPLAVWTPEEIEEIAAELVPKLIERLTSGESASEVA
jgi:hypothetical protein